MRATAGAPSTEPPPSRIVATSAPWITGTARFIACLIPPSNFSMRSFSCAQLLARRARDGAEARAARPFAARITTRDAPTARPRAPYALQILRQRIASPVSSRAISGRALSALEPGIRAEQVGPRNLRRRHGVRRQIACDRARKRTAPATGGARRRPDVSAPSSMRRRRVVGARGARRPRPPRSAVLAAARDRRLHTRRRRARRAEAPSARVDRRARSRAPARRRRAREPRPPSWRARLRRPRRLRRRRRWRRARGA